MKTTRILVNLTALSAILFLIPACISNGTLRALPTPPPSSGIPGARLYAGNAFIQSVTVFEGPFSKSSTAIGSIATAAAPGGIAVDPTDPAGAIFVSNNGAGQVLKFDRPNPNGMPAALTLKGFQAPGAIGFDSNGNLFVPDGAAKKVFELSRPITGSSVPSPVITSGLSGPECVVLDANNTLYVTDIEVSGPVLNAYSPPYTGAPVSTKLTTVNGAVCAYDLAANTLFVGSINAGTSIVGFALPLTTNEAPGITITTAACCPGAIAFDPSGNAFISLGVDVQPTIAVAVPPFNGQASFIFPAADYVRQFTLGP